MGDKESLIRSYITSLIQNYLPKHEETIHSGLFLALHRDKQLKILDWYFNGYSVISETISSHLQYLCKTNSIHFSNDGLYLCGTIQTDLASEQLEQTSLQLQSVLSEFKNGFQIIQEANRIFKSGR